MVKEAQSNKLEQLIAPESAISPYCTIPVSQDTCILATHTTYVGSILTATAVTATVSPCASTPVAPIICLVGFFAYPALFCGLAKNIDKCIGPTNSGP